MLPTKDQHRRYLWTGEPEAITALVASTNPQFVFEIGINEGRTAAMLLSQLSSIQDYIGVDVTPDYQPSLEQQACELTAQPGRLVPAHLRAKLALCISPRGSFDVGGSSQKMDAVFIDGDHGEKAVEHDTNLALNITRSGGMMIWHDYGTPGTAVARVLNRRPELKAKHLEGTHLAFAVKQ